MSSVGFWRGVGIGGSRGTRLSLLVLTRLPWNLKRALESLHFFQKLTYGIPREFWEDNLCSSDADVAKPLMEGGQNSDPDSGYQKSEASNNTRLTVRDDTSKNFSRSRIHDRPFEPVVKRKSLILERTVEGSGLRL